MKAFIAALVALALVPAAASAKEGIELSSLPNFLSAGEPWDVTISALPFPDERALPKSGVAVQITNEASGRTLRFAAPLLHDGGYHARVVFPSTGRWSYMVVGIGRMRQQEWAPVDIAPPRKPAVRAETKESSAFPFGWVGGGAALLVVIGALALRRHRAA